MCDSCTEYAPAGFRIAIIKLDAVGDVLRTTCILQGLKEAHPQSRITWVTSAPAVPLFQGNELVDRVLEAEDPATMARLSVEAFDLLINLDAAPRSAALAQFCTAARKQGYGMDASGGVVCFNPEAERWLQMGAFDTLKRANTRTYQDLMLEICGLRGARRDIILRLSAAEREEAAAFGRSHGLGKGARVVGMNTGAGPRWEMKKWTLEGYASLIRMVLEKTDWSVILYGGEGERERNGELSRERGPRVVTAETGGSLRSFFALLDLCHILITGDTLALHAGTALGKRVIALFGPTSEAEIETYGRVRKVVSETMKCRCYYRPVCDQDPNCMNTIGAERVFGILQEEARCL